MEHALTINLDQQVGPAGIHATRLCILNNKDESISCAFAGKREVHICSFKQSDGRSSNCINTINGLPFPSKLQEFEVTNTGINLPNDIQSITYSNGILAVADCQGNCFASNIHENTSKEYENTRNSGLFKSTGKWEQSWTGIALNGSKNPILACSGLLAAETVFWDVETSKQERNNIYHAQSPTASQFLSIGPSAHSEKYLVTAEWNTVVARDLRARISEVACILNMNKSPLYGLDISGDGNTLVFGGESRDISFVDVRKWAIRSKWKCPLKHDVVSVQVDHFGKYCFAAGLDHEVVTNLSNSNQQSKRKIDLVPQTLPAGSLLHKNHRVFRSQEQWIGFNLTQEDKNSKKFQIVGVDSLGIIYSLLYNFE